MRIILLSGGSGKRLWPLSNNARSKQFLPLLQTPSGDVESMVQRVVRQIGESRLTGKITIATNSSQRDIIINQLGDEVDIVTEPERRDTFPAIALATGYLSMAKQCAADEVVVIMPCDPYTETEYFDVIADMVAAVENNAADLVLMGINPTHPSTKFGYVVPVPEDCGKDILRVKRFTEKPDVARAEALLAEGAFWNGGVFAFRLGYMVNILEKYIKAASFDELRSRYSELPKISFDYEVAEKASSVAVLPFSGKWKDLGTWNSLTEELSSNAIGNVVLGEQALNTHVVNELGVPIFCNGVKDVVVASSPDGILVCGKEYSENIKNYVDDLSPRPMYEERRWGSYRVLDSSTYSDGCLSLTKVLQLKSGRDISYQIHQLREEVWTVVDGEGILVIDGETRKVSRGDVVVIGQGQKHAIKAVTDLQIVEVQIVNPLVEEDIIRLDWQW
ncbi:MAG: cupin domain-containing protein [Bacteroidaceae bacterium]|nr:cupin domain-containing protein [Bacteroidaceae bacterium]